MTRVVEAILLVLVGGLALWLLPTSVGSVIVAALLLLCLVIAAVLDWRSHSRRLLTVLATFIVSVDCFGLAHSYPAWLWLITLTLWLTGIWIIGHVGGYPTELFHQALASLLVVEVFLVLALWPINVLSQAAIVVAFAFFLWHELVRVVSLSERIQESVIPFTLIVLLMALTGHWTGH